MDLPGRLFSGVNEGLGRRPPQGDGKDLVHPKPSLFTHLTSERRSCGRVTAGYFLLFPTVHGDGI